MHVSEITLSSVFSCFYHCEFGFAIEAQLCVCARVCGFVCVLVFACLSVFFISVNFCDSTGLTSMKVGVIYCRSRREGQMT